MGGGSNSRFLWVLDPIDGTKSFITGGRDPSALHIMVKSGSPLLKPMPGADRRAGCRVRSAGNVVNGAARRLES